MNPIKEILAARGPTMIRISNVLDYSNDLSLVLKKFGLTPDGAALVAQDRANAIAISSRIFSGKDRPTTTNAWTAGRQPN